MSVLGHKHLRGRFQLLHSAGRVASSCETHMANLVVQQTRLESMVLAILAGAILAGAIEELGNSSALVQEVPRRMTSSLVQDALESE